MASSVINSRVPYAELLVAWALSLSACGQSEAGEHANKASTRDATRRADPKDAARDSTGVTEPAVPTERAAQLPTVSMTASTGAVAVPDDMVLVNGTEFFKGIDAPRSGFTQGKVETAGSFMIDRLEVSVAKYFDCQKEERCEQELRDGKGCNATSQPARLDHPMNCVTWHDAKRFCEAHGKRLPSSTEWELAARGTDRRSYPWGNERPGEQVCWQGRKGQRRSGTCPVGSFAQGASPYGLLDMCGNVAEWTTTVIVGAFPAPIYDTRGGSYLHDAMETEPDWTERRSDVSDGRNPNYPEPDIGFRCVKDIEPQ